MTYVEFKEKFLPEFLNIKSFKEKIRYADQSLQKIGAGSGRIVYDIDGEKVLKLAKNAKGIAQNEAEANAGYYRDTQHIVTIVYDNSDDYSWLISEKAKKVNEKRIIELTGIPSLNELFYYVKNFDSSNHGRGNIFHQEPEMVELLNENEFVQDLTNFIANYSQKPGDYGRPSTYGEVLRDGQPTIVLTDYGLNDEVYNIHYDSSKKKKYNIYEIESIENNAGVGDLLGDMPPQDGVDTRHAMWGLMPYDVGDGPGVINEGFISFILNRDKYPTRVLPSAPYLTDEFHNVLNNLNEVLEHIDDKKKFYNNLLELQNYLIRGKFFDREPLEKQEMQLNEEGIPVMAKFSLDRAYSDEVAKEFSMKLNLGAPTHLGGGSYGNAYTINNNRVLKLTTDVAEVDAGIKIQRAKPKTLVYVYKEYKIHDTTKNIALYALIEDFIPDKPKDEFNRYINIVDSLDVDFVNQMILLKKLKLDEYVNNIKLILSNKPEANVTQEDRQKTYNFMLGLHAIKSELKLLDIKSNDYSNTNNLGYKNGVLTFFDIGDYRVDEPQLPPEDIINLPEGEEEKMVLDEVRIKKEISDKIADTIVQKYGLNNPEYMGEGDYGIAYDIGDNKVLKVTSDKSEAVENLDLIGKPLKYIAIPYKVYEIKSQLDDRQYYVIILEKLRTDPEYFNRMNGRLQTIFKKIFNIELGDILDYYVYGYDTGVDEDKVNKYMAKNPEDKKYFEGLLNIVDEAKKYGVESMDYINPTNLGFKPNGNIGFFDVGFGNYFAKSANKPEEVRVDEDASALYSTDNALGQDNFPTYDNTADDSPITDNNIPANTAMYNEDLEYNHVVGDATKDKFELNERIKSFAPGSVAVEVKKKCRLAGNGNTSTACNQGDIRNLNLKAINENIDWQGKAYRVDTGFWQERGTTAGDVVRHERDELGNLEMNIPEEKLKELDKYPASDIIWVTKSFEDAKRYSNAEDNSDIDEFDLQGEVIAEDGDGGYLVLIKKSLNEAININIPSKLNGYNSLKILNDGQEVGELEVIDRGIFNDNHYLTVDKIFIDKQFRGNNYANDAMKILFEYADKNNIIIALTPDNMWGASVPKLKAWYKSLGFVENKGKKKDFQTMQLMYRLPKNSLNEEIDASEAYTDEGALQAMVDGKKDVAFIMFKYNPDLYNVVEKNNFGLIPIDQTHHNLDAHLVYRQNPRGKANAERLFQIMKTHGGYVNDQTPEEATEIGKLLDYNDRSIKQFIQRNYNKVPVLATTTDDYNDLDEQDFPSYEKRIEQDKETPGIDKQIIRQYNDGNETLKAIIVNGDAVRNSGFMTWVDGGNHYVDAYLPNDKQEYAKNIPEDEIWVDDVFMTKPDDMEATLLHERVERFIMKYFGFKYDPAHEIAQNVEFFYREKAKGISDDEEANRLSSVVFMAFKKKFEKTHKKKAIQNEDIADTYAQKQFGINNPNTEFNQNYNIKANAEANQEDIVYGGEEDEPFDTIIRNPKNLNDIGPNVRGIIDKEGNLYCELRASRLHYQLLDKLDELGLVKYIQGWERELPTEFVTVQRQKNTNIFALGESTITMTPDERRDNISNPRSFYYGVHSYKEAAPLFQEFLNRAQVKNSQIKFVNEKINFYLSTQNNELEANAMDEAKLMSLQDLPFKKEVEQLGGKIFSVGGAVRDTFLGKESKDLDVLITGIPMDNLEHILSKYGRVDAVGKSFGVLKFKPKGSTEDIDIAIPRQDKKNNGFLVRKGQTEVFIEYGGLNYEKENTRMSHL